MRFLIEFVPMDVDCQLRGLPRPIYAPPFIPSLFIGRVCVGAAARIVDLFMAEVRGPRHGASGSVTPGIQ